LKPPGPAEMLAFGGIPQTPSAQLRNRGLLRALEEHPDIRLRQLVNGEWSRQRAYQQARTLFERYPRARLVWSANDEMALGPWTRRGSGACSPAGTCSSATPTTPMQCSGGA